MAKKIVVRVDAVAKLPVVKSMEIDGEKMTVVGDVDVVCVAKVLRKAKFTPVVLSVGPEKEEKKPDEKKPSPEEPCKKPPCYAGCRCGYCCRRPPPPVLYCQEQAVPGCVIL